MSKVPVLRSRANWLLFAGLMMALIFSVIGTTSMVKAAPGEVVMLSTSDAGFGAGRIITAFNSAGKTVVTKTPAEWAAMTAADFAAYDAVVLADPTCASSVGTIQAAVDNAAVWGSVVDGNVIIIGTDEQFHQGSPFGTGQGALLMDGAAAFVVAQEGTTGAYISLSCYYHGVAPDTAVPMLDDAFGSAGDFTVTGVPGCFDDVKIVAAHPALASVTDAILSNWSCSVHEAFDNWPIDFEVLAMAVTGTAFTAPDGTVGTPYILARGVAVISDIKLAPETDTNEIGDTHTVTATVVTDDPDPDTPVVGTEVTFTVIAGPHAGTTGNATTDGDGKASFSYMGTAAGIDTIEATFVDGAGRTQRSNRVTKEWVDDGIVGPPDTGHGPRQIESSSSGAWVWWALALAGGVGGIGLARTARAGRSGK